MGLVFLTYQSLGRTRPDEEIGIPKQTVRRAASLARLLAAPREPFGRLLLRHYEQRLLLFV